MKLRILDNSLRLRLRKSEVAQFGANGFLESRAEFQNGGNFVYRLEASGCPEIMATLRPDGITVQIPKLTAKSWVESGDVSLQAVSGSLAVLIEKDFQRTSVRSPIDFDLYPNPRSLSPR